jgi:hypothetical protein
MAQAQGIQLPPGFTRARRRAHYPGQQPPQATPGLSYRLHDNAPVPDKGGVFEEVFFKDVRPVPVVGGEQEIGPSGPGQLDQTSRSIMPGVDEDTVPSGAGQGLVPPPDVDPGAGGAEKFEAPLDLAAMKTPVRQAQRLAEWLESRGQDVPSFRVGGDGGEIDVNINNLIGEINNPKTTDAERQFMSAELVSLLHRRNRKIGAGYGFFVWNPKTGQPEYEDRTAGSMTGQIDAPFDGGISDPNRFLDEQTLKSHLTDLLRNLGEGGVTEEQRGIEESQFIEALQQAAGIRRGDAVQRGGTGNVFGGVVESDLDRIGRETEIARGQGLAKLRLGILEQQNQNRKEALAGALQLAGLSSTEAIALAGEITRQRIAQAGLAQEAEQFGTTEGRLRDEFAATEGRLRDEFGTTESRLRDEFGTVEDRLRDEFGTTEGRLRDEFGTVEDRYRHQFDTTEARLRDEFVANNEIQLKSLGIDAVNAANRLTEAQMRMVVDLLDLHLQADAADKATISNLIKTIIEGGSAVG